MIYGIFPNNEIKEYDTLKSSFANGADFSFEVKIQRNNDTSWPIKTNILIFNQKETNCVLHSGLWRSLTNRFTYESDNYYRGPLVDIKIVDPHGEVQNIRLSSQKAELVIRDFMVTLKKLSSWNSWIEYNQDCEIQRLKEELRTHKDE